MDPASYQRFTETLTHQLSHYGDVLALVALGSMAARDHLPDRFSDHDFFVIVRPGTQSWYRENLQWLPEHDRIAFAFQETAHGMKVLYDDRHMLEFAVFDPDELHQARINRYRVLFDRADLSATLEQLAAREASSPEVDVPYQSGQFLTHLLVGLWRYQRGERLSAFRFLREFALQELVRLTHALATADRPHRNSHSSPARNCSWTASSASPHPGRTCHTGWSRWFARSSPQQPHRRNDDRTLEDSKKPPSVRSCIEPILGPRGRDPRHSICRSRNARAAAGRPRRWFTQDEC